MTDYLKMKNVIAERVGIDDEDTAQVNNCWEEMVQIFSADISNTILFLDNECTEDEFSWLSEVFEQIAERTKSREFIECLRRVAQKYPDETKKYNIDEFIDSAETYLQ